MSSGRLTSGTFSSGTLRKEVILVSVPPDDLHLDDSAGKPKEACGVFGLYSREAAGQLAQRTYFGLYAMQHRGQESAGIAISDGERTTAFRDMGLISQVFDGPRLAALQSGPPAPGPLPSP